MIIKDIRLGKKAVQGVEVPLLNGNLVMVTAPKGFIMCGYLNMATAEKLGDCAAIVRGVKTIEDLLASKIVEVSQKALKMGIKPGMKAQTALSKMF